MPQLQGPGGHWYVGGPASGECVTNALPVDDGMSVAWALDLWRIWEVLLGWLVKQAEEGGEAMAEEKSEEEDRRRRSSMAGGVVPLQVPKMV